MRRVEVAVVGAGPAGLGAALAAASQGAGVLVIDNACRPGGQLVKQTHKFFGSRRQRAGTRGIEIADLLAREAMERGVEMWLDATALGYYPADGVLTVEHLGRFRKVVPRALVIATGASERMLAFPGNDLPGVYGAGAVQTLMNVHGVKPGQRVLMVGAGNIGLIVSYQLIQAGVEVAAVVEAAPRIGGYAVHASKLRRLGVPILVSHSVKAAHGSPVLDTVTTWQVDHRWEGIPGSERDYACDVLCLSVGLSPLTDLMWQAGCDMRYIPELGGYVPTRDREGRTSVPGLWVAGDAGGVEEASSAMATGRLAGLGAARFLGYDAGYEEAAREVLDDLAALRAGPTGAKIRKGLERLQGGTG
ncbi:MAG: FAD-dependent oxidoreductase [Bacillota bacterium]